MEPCFSVQQIEFCLFRVLLAFLAPLAELDLPALL